MITNKSEFIAELDSLLESAKSGQFSSEEISRLEELSSCARDSVPDFGSEGPPVEDDFDIEDESTEKPAVSVDFLSGEPEDGGEGAPLPKKKPRMFPEYKMRGGK